MRAAVAPSLLLICGCRSLLGIEDAVTLDAAAPELDGSAPDAMLCRVGAMSATGTDRGKVGLSNGGGNIRPVACDGDARMIGLALDMSDGPVNGLSSRSARGIRIGCATVTIDASGAHTGAITTKDVAGTGGAGWTPSTMTALAVCPPGGVVSGLMAHGSAVVVLFLDATMTCSTFDTRGQVIGQTLVPIAGSLTDPMSPSQAQCGAGEQLVSMTVTTGAGLDAARLFCAPTACQ